MQKKSMLKILACLISLFTAVFSLSGCVVYSTADGFTFGVVDDTYYYLKSYTGEEDEISIPASFEGKEVSYVGEYALSGNPAVVVVTFGSGVAEIKSRAFYNMPNLAAVTVPESMKLIGEYAFSDCKRLGNVKFESDYVMKRIEAYAFANNTLHSFAFPSGIEYISPYALYNNTAMLRVYADGTTSGDYTVDTTGLIYYKGNQIFYYPSGNLTKVYKTGASITAIGEAAFACSVNLKRLVLTEAVDSIAANAFKSSSVRGLVVYPETQVAANAFASSALVNVYFKGTQTEYDAFIGSVGEGNSALVNATCLLYSETQTANGWYFNANGLPVPYNSDYLINEQL